LDFLKKKNLQFAGDWYVLAYKGDPALPEKKCARIKVEVGQQDNRTTIVYKFNYQEAGKAKSAEFFTQALRPIDASTGFGVFVKTNYWESKQFLFFKNLYTILSLYFGNDFIKK